MRYLLLSTLLVLGFVACKQTVKGKNGVTYKSASEYNDFIVNRQTTLMKKVVEFGKAAKENLDSAEAMVKQSAVDVEKMIIEIKGMPAYKGDSALRDAAVTSFSFYKRIFEKDYMDILAIRKKGDENITEADITEQNRIVASITSEEAGLDKIFQAAQREYASKNNMKLLEDKAQNELKKEAEKMDKE